MPRPKDFNEDELLNKALNLFWSKGYHATSAQDLVKELGISRSSLYNTYADKHALFCQALKQYQAQNTQAVLDLLKNTGDPDKAIRELLGLVIKESEEDTLAKGCFMVNTAVELASHDQEIADMVKTNNQSVEDALTQTIERGQHGGYFKTQNHPRAIARFIFNIINGLRVSARSGAGSEVLEDTVRVALSALN